MSHALAMDFSFNARRFRSLLQGAVADHIADITTDSTSEETPEQLLAAMEQAVDVMERADADKAARNGEMVLSATEITEIGDYALGLLETLVERVESVSGHQSRELSRFAIPISLWIAQHGGYINKLELVVNSLAAWANELQDTIQIADLVGVIRQIIDATSAEIRQDLDQSNPMRPWRIINLNYGIVATRSHDPTLMEEAFALLVENLPQDARAFFKEGMQQMDSVGYPEEVREVVQRYERMWGSDKTLH